MGWERTLTCHHQPPETKGHERTPVPRPDHLARTQWTQWTQWTAWRPAPGGGLSWVSVCSETKGQTKSTLRASPRRSVQGQRYRPPTWGSLGRSHLSHPLGGTLVEKSAQSKSESTFLSRITHAPAPPKRQGSVATSISTGQTGPRAHAGSPRSSWHPVSRILLAPPASSLC